MLVEQLPAVGHHSVRKWMRIGGFVLLGTLLTGIVILALNWPFSQKAILKALEEASGRPVQIDTFSNSYFPPGCTVEGVRFLRHKHPEGSPIITVQKLVIQGSLTGLFGSTKRLAAVRVIGMRMTIPPKTAEDGKSVVVLNEGAGGKSLTIAKITADNALLEFVPEDRTSKPYVLKIDRLGITGVGSGSPMSYRATLTNTEPPGVIHAEGKFGPWNPTDIGETPVSGSYTYDDIELNHFKGITGTGHAKGEFSGPLARILTKGSVDVTAFRVDGSDHSVPLSTTYEATVNGTNGDVLLNPAVASYRRTRIEVRGRIAAVEGEGAKTASFDIAIARGRVEDLLYLLAKDPPGMSGNVSAHGKFLWPPGPSKFLEKIRLDLVCGMSDSRFTNTNTQDSIDRISESAQGEKKKQQNEDPRTVLSDFQGSIELRGGTAAISGGRFEVPGADAMVHGTYNLLNGKIDLHGMLNTRGSVADSTSGFKALVLKAITPLFKKRGPTRIVPFQITGVYGDASVGIDWRKDLKR